MNSITEFGYYHHHHHHRHVIRMQQFLSDLPPCCNINNLICFLLHDGLKLWSHQHHPAT